MILYPASQSGKMTMVINGSIRSVLVINCALYQVCLIISNFIKHFRQKKPAAFLNYQHIKMYLQSTKDCQTELSFSFLPVRQERENFKRFTLEMQLKELEIPNHTEHTFEVIPYCQVQQWLITVTVFSKDKTSFTTAKCNSQWIISYSGTIFSNWPDFHHHY